MAFRFFSPPSTSNVRLVVWWHQWLQPSMGNGVNRRVKQIKQRPWRIATWIIWDPSALNMCPRLKTTAEADRSHRSLMNGAFLRTFLRSEVMCHPENHLHPVRPVQQSGKQLPQRIRMIFDGGVPSGRPTNHYGKSPFYMEKHGTTILNGNFQ